MSQPHSGKPVHDDCHDLSASLSTPVLCTLGLNRGGGELGQTTNTEEPALASGNASSTE